MKLKLGDKFIRFAYRFVDVEASDETAVIDERMIEYSFVLSRLFIESNKQPIFRILDIGCTSRINPIPATMCELGCSVWGIDIRKFKYEHPNFKFALGDIRNNGFPSEFFDSVCAVSTLEHIGVSGRYGVGKDSVNGDIAAVNAVWRVLKEDGKFLITLPCGSKGSTLNRVYDDVKLDRLFSEWNIRTKRFYCHHTDGSLVPISKYTEKSALALLEMSKK